MEKRKVLFLSAANSIHTIRWVNALSKEFEVHLVYCKNHKPDIDNIDNEVILHKLNLKAPLAYYFGAVQLKKMYKDIRPDIINVHYASGYGTLARIAKLPNILLSVWGSDVYDFPNESKIKKKILQKNVMYAKKIASTSNIMAEELKKQVPELKEEIYITPFGVDIDKFKNMNIVRKDNNFNIGNIKKLEEKYGIIDLIISVERLIKKLEANKEKELASTIKLYIYGEGSQKQKLEEMIKEKKLENHIFLMGKIPNKIVPEKLNQLDVFCATSVLNSESFGVAVVEAMACEVPVISTDVDGFAEVMDNEITGYIVEKKNIEQIIEALEKMLRNEELRKKCGINGRKRVIEKYDWKENVNNMVKIYNELYKGENE